MSRRSIVTKDEIYLRRANNWSWHYDNRAVMREIVSSIGESRVCATVAHYVPEPIMLIDGDILGTIERLRGECEALRSLRLGWKLQRLMCAWYTTEAGWLEFVRQFQSLEEVYEDYYLFYDAELDAVHLLPLSSKPKQGCGIPVDIRVEKPGTSQVQVGRFRYK